jgi:DnaJ-class molecular chaperone
MMKDPCGFCDGTGTLRCEVCDGAGIFAESSLLDDLCPKCKGAGKEICPECEGSGEQRLRVPSAYREAEPSTPPMRNARSGQT